MKINYNAPEVIDELVLIQALINDKERGSYKAMLIIKGHERAIDNNVNFGMRLREYVRSGKLNNIEAMHIEMGSNHWLYALHGGDIDVD